MRRLTIILVCFLLVVPMAFGGCASSDDAKTSARAYQSPESVHETNSKQVASNSRFKLFWDNDRKCLLLSDAQSDKIWSTVPYDFYTLPDTDGIAKVRMESPIYLEYFDSTNNAIKISYGYVDVLSNGLVEAGKTADGFKVTYYFEDLEISVPVLYILQEDGLEIRLPVNEIRERNKWVYSVSLAPFLCAAKAGTDSYLFVPSGSGALMSTEESSRGVRTFSDYVYGKDRTINVMEAFYNDTSIRLPVFGVKENNNALCAVIGKGAELARIEAQAGNEEIGYASAYTTFELRSRNQITTKGNNNRISVSTRLSSTLVDTDYVSVTYYPLNGEDADYTGMAKLYRNKLFPDGSAPSAEETPLHVQFLGGTMVQKNMLGVPYKTLSAATTFAQAQRMLKEITDKTQVKPTAELTGFGKSGLDIGEIAGGFTFGSAFGNKEKLAALRDYCKDQDISLFADFDLINYNQSGKGISTFTDCIKTINHTRAKQQIFKNTVYTVDDRYPAWYLLNYGNLSKTAESLKTLLDKHQLNGVSLRSLSSVTYSDSSDARYYAKNGFPEIAASVFRNLKDDGKRISTAEANAYAAVLSDYIADSPTVSAKVDGFDAEIPFYQIVFKGIVPMAVSPVNTATNSRTQFLKAIESGCALSFSLCDSWSSAYADSLQQELHSSVYSNWKNELISLTKEATPFLKAVSGATIVQHNILSDDVRQTVFSNGVQVYINTSGQAAKTPIGDVPANGFIFKEGEG